MDIHDISSSSSSISKQTPPTPLRMSIASNIVNQPNSSTRSDEDNDQQQTHSVILDGYLFGMQYGGRMQEKQHQSPIPLPVVSRSIATSSLLNDNNNNNNVKQLSRRTSFGENNSRRNLDDAYNNEMSVSIQPSNKSDIECQQGVFYLPNQQAQSSAPTNADDEDDTPGRKKKKRSLSLTMMDNINLTRRGSFGSIHELQSHSFCLSKKSIILSISILAIVMVLGTSWNLREYYESYSSSRRLNTDSESQSDINFDEQFSAIAPCSSYKSAIFCLYQSDRCSWIGGDLGCVPISSPPTSNSASPTPKPTSRPTRKPTTQQPTPPIDEYSHTAQTPEPTQPSKAPTNPTRPPTPPTNSPVNPTNSPSLSSATKIPTTKVPTTKSPTTPAPTDADEYTDAPTKVPTTRSPTIKSPTTSTPTTTLAPTFEATTSNGDGDGEGEDPTAGYDIEIIFSNPSTSSAVIQAFLNAKKRWESIITNDIQSTYIYKAFGGCFGATTTILSYDKVVDDLLIFADIEYIDGKGGVLGSAGPCIATNTGGKYTRVGLMRFDSTDLDQLQKDGTLESVITHEMGHVIGIGTLWSTFKLRDDTGKYYVGAGGAEGLKDLRGSGQPLIEMNGGAGTAGGHWDESTYQNELMTGWLNPNSKLSVMTVKALKDLGFTVNTQYADNDYVIPAKGRLRALDEVGHDVPNDVINKPLVFDDDNVVPYDENGNRRIL